MDIATPTAAEAALSAAASTALVFVHDRDSEGVIRQCLIDLSLASSEFKNGGIADATAALASRPSPRLLIVDVDGADDPVARVHDLANVCDPGTGVIAIGSTNDIRLYRDLRSAGIMEYYFKPLVPALVMQTCHAIVTGNTSAAPSRTGRLVFVVGVRGGAGATTIAVATAWHMAEAHNRRVSILDLDLQFGDAALQLGVTPSHALQAALNDPDRVDELFLDRGMTRVGKRLNVFAALESLDGTLLPQETAVLSLLEKLAFRDRYVFVDVPMTSAPHLMNALHLPGTILLVSSGSLVCARDVARLRESLGPNSPARTTMHILNKRGAGDCLSDEEFVRGAGAPPDLTIPYAREIAVASRLGVQGLAACSALQRGLAPLFSQLSGEEPASPRKSLLQSLFG